MESTMRVPGPLVSIERCPMVSMANKFTMTRIHTSHRDGYLRARRLLDAERKIGDFTRTWMACDEVDLANVWVSPNVLCYNIILCLIFFLKYLFDGKIGMAIVERWFVFRWMKILYFLTNIIILIMNCENMK